MDDPIYTYVAFDELEYVPGAGEPSLVRDAQAWLGGTTRAASAVAVGVALTVAAALRRLALLAALVPIPALLSPHAVAAHDDLVSASPGEGDTLRVVPDSLRLVFTRGQNLDLASVVLVGPAGEVPLGDLTTHPDSAAVVMVPIRGAWAPGGWTVRWRIVGQDGHPVSGDYGFVVAEDAEGLPEREPEDPDPATVSPPAVPAGAAGDATAQEEASFGVSSPPYVAIRWVAFGALVTVLGAVAWALLVLPLSARRHGGMDVEWVRRSVAVPGAWAGGAVILAALARLWAQSEALGDPGNDVLVSMVVGTVWGVGWIVQVLAGLAVVAAFLWARRGGGAPAWTLAGAASLALAFTPALSGHAVGLEGPTAVAVLADGIHVLAAGGWMGGLLVLLAGALPTVLRQEGGARAIAPLVEAFSITALGFAALLVLSGVVSGWLHLGSVGALWGSTYGRTLGLKLLLLVPLLALGAYNWLRVRPALSRGDGGVGRLRRSGAAELGIAGLVLLVTAVLVATPPPADAGGGQVAASTISSTSPEGP